MGSVLPALDPDDFRARLAELAPLELSDSAFRAFFQHYEELRRWNARLSLVGPGTAHEVLPRHFGESLAALPLIQPDDREILDLGSGGGFPGIVLAAALADRARPPRLTLVEARERKWSFLRTVIRRTGLSCRCLNARVRSPLPDEIRRQFEIDRVDLVTCRAVALSPDLFEALLEGAPRARFLLWCGSGAPTLPAHLEVRRSLDMPGSRSRRLLEIVRNG